MGTVFLNPVKRLWHKVKKVINGQTSRFSRLPLQTLNLSYHTSSTALCHSLFSMGCPSLPNFASERLQKRTCWFTQCLITVSKWLVWQACNSVNDSTSCYDFCANCSYTSINKNDILFLSACLAFLFCADVKWNSCDSQGGEDQATSQEKVHISNANGLHGLQGSWPESRFVYDAGWSIWSHFWTSAMQVAANMRMEYPGLRMGNFYKFVICTFPGKDSLKADRNCRFWKPIFNYVVYKQACRDHDRGGQLATVIGRNC